MHDNGRIVGIVIVVAIGNIVRIASASVRADMKRPNPFLVGNRIHHERIVIVPPIVATKRVEVIVEEGDGMILNHGSRRARFFGPLHHCL